MDIGDQPRHQVPDRDSIVDGWQRLRAWDDSALLAASNSTQFRGLIGIGVEEAESAWRRESPARIAVLRRTFATRITLLG
jgi:hypothetical protein